MPSLTNLAYTLYLSGMTVQTTDGIFESFDLSRVHVIVTIRNSITSRLISEQELLHRKLCGSVKSLRRLIVHSVGSSSYEILKSDQRFAICSALNYDRASYVARKTNYRDCGLWAQTEVKSFLLN